MNFSVDPSLRDTPGLAGPVRLLIAVEGKPSKSQSSSSNLDATRAERRNTRRFGHRSTPPPLTLMGQVSLNVLLDSEGLRAHNPVLVYTSLGLVDDAGRPHVFTRASLSARCSSVQHPSRFAASVQFWRAKSAGSGPLPGNRAGQSGSAVAQGYPGTMPTGWYGHSPPCMVRHAV